MANYLLDQTGAEVQAILDAVQNPDTTPVQGSSNLITSGGVQAAIAGSAAEIGAEVSALGHKVGDLNMDINGVDEDVDLTTLDVRRRMVSPVSNYTWQYQSDSSHTVILVEYLESVKITAASSAANISFFRDYDFSVNPPASGSHPDFATGWEDTLADIPVGETRVFQVPADAKYLYVLITASNQDRTPAKIHLFAPGIMPEFDKCVKYTHPAFPLQFDFSAAAIGGSYVRVNQSFDAVKGHKYRFVVSGGSADTSYFMFRDADNVRLSDDFGQGQGAREFEQICEYDGVAYLGMTIVSVSEQVVYNVNVYDITLPSGEEITEALAKAQYAIDEGKKSTGGLFDLSGLVSICHRGNTAVDAPENSIFSITNAYFQGQKFVECDVKATSDGVYVIMHDNSINRTMNTAADVDISGDPEILVSSLTLAQLQSGYIYKTTVTKYKTPVTTFAEWLDRVAQLKLIPMFHNLPVSLVSVVREKIGENFIYMGQFANCKTIRALSPKCFIMYQFSQYESGEAITDIDALIGEMEEIGGRVGYSSMTFGVFTDSVIKAIKAAGYQFQYSTEGSTSIAEAIKKGAGFILANNVFNNALTYRQLYRMKNDLSNIPYTNTENGCPKYAANDTFSIDVTPNGNNVKMTISVKGALSVSVGGTTHTFGDISSFNTYIVGLNTTAASLTFAFTCTQQSVIRELVIESA